MEKAGAFISAIDYAVPARRVSNSELAQTHPGWRMDRVVQSTGVEYRHWASESETALDLAEAACRKLIERGALIPERIDALLFCTQTPDYIMPPNACLLQDRLGLPRTVAAFDYTLACSGFVYGLFMSKALIESGMAQNVLLVTADTYSRLMNPEDRATMTLFGDGAAATVITAGRPGLKEFLLATDGRGGPTFMVPSGGARTPRLSVCAARVDGGANGKVGSDTSSEHIVMRGAAVLDFVKKEIPGLVRALLDKASLTMDDLDLLFYHQASQVSLEYLYRALNVPPNKQFRNIANVGNTVSASIPMALREAELQGALKPGMRVMLVGFGVGLSWGGCVVNW
ncbi:MAG: ketoacyl-ACP synthase III [Chloroflexi bacterium]|nr:ketoacyl-ACP synthase III [Chloroflexota bacterium]